MKFEASDCTLFIRGNILSKKPYTPIAWHAHLFYGLIFFWFIFLFLKRVVKIQFDRWWDWFMVLLSGAVIMYYFLTFIYNLYRNRKKKFDILEIRSAGGGNTIDSHFVVWIMHSGEKGNAVFDDESESHAFLEMLRQKNSNIELIEIAEN